MPYRAIRDVTICTIASLMMLVLELPLLGADPWQAGAAKTTITPESPMWMSGYGSRDKPAEGKLTDLWAKAVVLQDARGQRAALITLDLVGIDRGLGQAICQELKEKYGLERHQVALATSHTHTGPAVGRNLWAMLVWRLDEARIKEVRDYDAFLQQRVVAVVGEALSRLGPAQVSWGSGQATFGVNRRTNSEAQVPELRTAGALKGPQDHDVPVLAVHDPEGKLKAIVFGYACHATVLSFFQWSGDYPGFAMMELEQLHPEAVALFWAGCGGDQNPLPRRTVEHARHYGRRLADAVEAVLLTSKLQPIEGDLNATYREVDLPFRQPLPTRDEIVADSKSSDSYVASRAKLLLADIDGGHPLSNTYPYPVAVWQLGKEVQFVILGGEVVVDYALRLKSELRGTRTWVAGYSNDVMAYIPSRRVLMEGGYEGGGSMVYYGQPTLWAPEVEETIVEEVHRQAFGREAPKKAE